MIWVIFDLLTGDTQIPQMFVAARKFWQAFFRDKKDWTFEQFREWFSMQNQMHYEFALPGGDRLVKKALMVFTCLGALCENGAGFGDNHDLAIKVAKAMLTGSLSIEVIEFGKETVRLFQIDRKVRRKGRLGEAVPLGPPRRSRFPIG
ncbi:MAG TPA: hypothetical protein VJN94_07375 [Candidatus Binataceae bacterium]|nr:hypothetical protein [Candidatus Binataceae bacterium]